MIKTFISVFIFFLLIDTATFAQAQEHKKPGIQWMSIENAVSQSKQQKKKVFIDFYTNWCGWCKRMDATTFVDPAVVEYMNKNFYAVKFDAETRDTVNFNGKGYLYRADYKANELAAEMLNGSMSYPTTVYLDENLNEISPVPGYLTAEQILPVLKYFSEDIYKTKKWDDYVKDNYSK